METEILPPRVEAAQADPTAHVAAVAERLSIRKAILIDVREVTIDFSSSMIRIVISYKVMMIFVPDRGLMLSTACLLGGTRVVDKGTNWMHRTRDHARHAILRLVEARRK